MKFIIPVIILLGLLSLPPQAQAVCPVCTVVVAAGLGISRYLGVDDIVSGVWIGGLIVSSGLWLASWIEKKNWKIPYKESLSVILFYLLVLPPLYWWNMIGIPGNTLWGIDKILLGTMAGSLAFLSGVVTDKWLRTKNNGEIYFYYQKVLIPVLFLSIASFIFYEIIIY